MFVYFIGSWILGLMITVITFSFGDDDLYSMIFVFLTGFNAIVNFIFILFQLIMISVFPENRADFSKSIVMLLFNFPFILIYCFLIVITYWILINI